MTHTHWYAAALSFDLLFHNLFRDMGLFSSFPLDDQTCLDAVSFLCFLPYHVPSYLHSFIHSFSQNWVLDQLVSFHFIAFHRVALKILTKDSFISNVAPSVDTAVLDVLPDIEKQAETVDCDASASSNLQAMAILGQEEKDGVAKDQEFEEQEEENKAAGAEKEERQTSMSHDIESGNHRKDQDDSDDETSRALESQTQDGSDRVQEQEELVRVPAAGISHTLQSENGYRTVPITCSICLLRYQVGSEVVWSSNVKCGHCFHRSCMERWILRRLKDQADLAMNLLFRPPFPFANSHQNVTGDTTGTDSTNAATPAADANTGPGSETQRSLCSSLMACPNCRQQFISFDLNQVGENCSCPPRPQGLIA